MLIADFLKRFSYSPIIGAGIRRLGLRRVMQRAYAAFRGNPGSVELSLNGLTAIFQLGRRTSFVASRAHGFQKSNAG